jgi:hypothetical protein
MRTHATVFIFSALVADAQAADLAGRYRSIAESWLGGEMYVRCAERDFKIERDWWGTYIVQQLPPSASDWQTMGSPEATARGIRFRVNGTAMTLDGEFEPIRAQLLEAIAERPADGGFDKAYNYQLEPETMSVDVDAEIDVYDRTLRIYAAEQADFLWNFDNSIEHSVPASIPAGAQLADVKCEAN